LNRVLFHVPLSQDRLSDATRSRNH